MWLNKLMAVGVAALGATVIASACAVAEDPASEGVQSEAAAIQEEPQPCNPRRGQLCQADEACVLYRRSVCDNPSGVGCDGVCVDIPRGQPAMASWTYRPQNLCASMQLRCAPAGVPFLAADGCGCVRGPTESSACPSSCLPSEDCCQILGCCVDKGKSCSARNCNVNPGVTP